MSRPLLDGKQTVNEERFRSDHLVSFSRISQVFLPSSILPLTGCYGPNGRRSREGQPTGSCRFGLDHSVQVDVSGANPDALQMNLDIEYHRNMERYTFLKWGQQSLANFQAVPPSRGIVHQVNLEFLARLLVQKTTSGLLIRS